MAYMYIFRGCMHAQVPKKLADGSHFTTERDNWQKVFPEFNGKVVCEQWCGRASLWIPHFAAVKDQDSLKTLELVKATLTVKFASKGLVHEDVAWWKIGVHKHGGVTNHKSCCIRFESSAHTEQAKLSASA